MKMQLMYPNHANAYAITLYANVYVHYINPSPKHIRQTPTCTSNISRKNPLPLLDRFIVPNE